MIADSALAPISIPKSSLEANPRKLQPFEFSGIGDPDQKEPHH
jgi:hypothetical protein